MTTGAMPGILVQAWIQCKRVWLEKLVWGRYEPLVIVAPVVVYWTLAIMYDFVSYLDIKQVERYRLHSAQEEVKRNVVSKGHVITRTLVQHCIQSATIFVGFALEPDQCDKPWPGYAALAAQLIGAFLCFDTWQYFIHRLMHENTFLYRTIHSRHHQLLAPYAYGALYNHPVEAFLLDSVGSILVTLVAKVSCQATLVFAIVATAKTVFDHCGYGFPINPAFHISENNSRYHEVHHQPRGFKKNFAQPFFSFWDRVLGTYADPDDFYNTDKKE